MTSSISSVVVDYKDVGYRATMHLIERGCKHIGLINGSMKVIPYADRYEGYLRALKRKKLKEITTEHLSKLRGMKYGYDCAMELVEKNKELDAILAATDAQGIGVLRALKEKKIRVPEDVRVVSMTGHLVGDMLETSLTSMELPGFQIGAHAAELVIRAIRQGADTLPLQHLQFEAALAERESTA